MELLGPTGAGVDNKVATATSGRVTKPVTATLPNRSNSELPPLAPSEPGLKRRVKGERTECLLAVLGNVNFRKWCALGLWVWLRSYDKALEPFNAIAVDAKRQNIRIRTSINT